MDENIRTIFVRERMNPFLRILSIISFYPLLVTIMAMIYWIDHDMSTQSINYYLQICALSIILPFIFNYRYIKYYLYKIDILPNGEIYFEYYSWFKLINVKYTINQIDIRYEQELYSHLIRIIVNPKTFLKQYEGGWWSFDKLDRKKLRQFYEEMKKIIHDHKISAS